MTAVAALLLAVQSAGAPAPSGVLSIAISGLRSERGTVRLCMTRHRAYFPDCSRDPEALSRSVAASRDTVEFDRVPLGEYAIAVIHDENNNRKLDTLFGIPREGFGFSRKPVPLRKSLSG